MNVLNKRNGKDTNIFNPDFTTDQTMPRGCCLTIILI